MTRSGAPAAAQTLIQDVRVFDGSTFVDGVDVLLAGSVVVEVGRGLRPDGDAQTLDGAGRTLLPGLIDAHVHARPDSTELALAFGVTTVVDMGSEPHVMVPLRERCRARNDLADVVSASSGATPKGGHPSMLVGSVFERPLPSVETPAQAQEFVAARAGEGADFIKLVLEDGVAFGMQMPALDGPTAAALVGAAHTSGLQAVAHVHSQAAAWKALEAGCDGLAHLWLDGPVSSDLLKAIVARGTFVIPTMTLLESMSGVASGAGLAGDARLDSGWSKNLTRAWRLPTPASFDSVPGDVKVLADAGVPILAGTDCAIVGVPGTAPGASVHRELELLVAAGLTVERALAAATSTVSDCFDCLGDRGRIRPGATADLLLVDGDPREDIIATRALAAVWRRGELLEHEHGHDDRADDDAPAFEQRAQH